MVRKLLWGTILMSVLASFSACGPMYIRQDYVFLNHFQNKHDISNVYQACSGIYTNHLELFNKMELFCSSMNKRAQLVGKSYLDSCSLFSPVVYSFVCK